MLPAILVGLSRAIWRSILYLVLLAASIAVYRLFFHPLAKVPGPTWAALSNVWYACHARNGDMLRLGKTLHQKYGPAVRVGPNEVWFDSKDSCGKIYSATSGYDKSDFYSTSLNRPKFHLPRFTIHSADTLDLLSERDMDRYRLQRRLIGPLYSSSNVLKYEKAVDEVLVKVVAQLKALQGTDLDLKMWMHIISVECLSAMVLSYSPGYLKARNDFGSSSHAYMNWRRKSVFALFKWAVMAESYSKAAGRLFARLWHVTFVTPAPFKPFFTPVYSKITKRIAAALQPRPPKDDRKDLIADLIDLHKEKPDFTLPYLKRMAMTNFGAGHETTTSALISSVTMIASHRETLAKIRAELGDQRPNLSSEAPIPPFTTLQNLSCLPASIKESQRLYPVLGMSPSRTVPPPGLEIHSHHIPAGTRVGCNPISLHRNPDIFGPEDTALFRPSRWLTTDIPKLREMERCNLTWGGGARTCPGKNLAQLILFKVVATLFRQFDVEVTHLPDEEREMKWYFMAMMTGVKVRLSVREEGDAGEGILGGSNGGQGQKAFAA